MQRCPRELHFGRYEDSERECFFYVAMPSKDKQHLINWRYFKVKKTLPESVRGIDAQQIFFLVTKLSFLLFHIDLYFSDHSLSLVTELALPDIVQNPAF